MKAFRNGVLTGLALQIAIGPVFFYIMNLNLQKTIFDGLIGSVGVMLGDYFYITLSVLGVSKILENKKIERTFSVISSIVLIIFGIFMINNGLHSFETFRNAMTPSLFSSFISCFFLTVSGPISMVLFTSIFTARAAEFNYTEKDLIKFGIGVGLATFIFMASSSVIFSIVKGAIPVLLIQIMNILIGCFLIGYGGIRAVKTIKIS